MKYLIIGGVAGGATVAARLRRMDEKAEIILFERGKYVSYANCGLPYYIGDTINDRNKLFVQTVKGFTDRFRIDIRTEQEVTQILPESKQVEVKKLGTGETYTETYDKLVLSPGAEPLRPRIEGIESKKIFTLRNVPDTDTIKNYVNTEKPRTAVVVGGGFIGLEMAENLHELGVHVTVVEMANQVMAPLDYSMAAIVHQQLIGKQVGLMLEDGVSRFEETSRGVTVHLKSGKQIPADMVLLSIGVRPETRLAKEAGLTIGALGGIAVNEYMMQIVSGNVFSNHSDLSDTIRWTAIVSGKIPGISIASSTGVHDWEDVVKCLLAGASAVQMCSAVYTHGAEIISQVLTCVEEWMHQAHYQSLSQFQGKLNYANIPNPAMYERSQFMKYFSNRD